MKCQKTSCGGRLRVTHTYIEGNVRHQRAACSVCGMSHVVTSFAEPARRGAGARARAEAAKKAVPS